MTQALSTLFLSSFLFLTLGTFSALYAKSTPSHDTLARAQRTLTDAMKANNIRLRVASENMAGSKTADYVPKNVQMKTTRDPRTKSTSVAVKKITQDKSKMIKKYDPSHPKADAQGNVNMPKLDPLMTMMDMHQAKLDNERAMKSYQMTTDMRQRTLQMMN